MLIPLSWLTAVLPSLTAGGREVADALLRVGLEVERVEVLGIEHLVVGRVASFAAEPQKNGKTIRWCSVDVGGNEPRGIVCGADNFVVGDLVVVALPGAVLPGGFAIGARKTYGHVSDGMICSTRELGIGDDHDGILVLPAGTPVGADAAQLLSLGDEVLDIAVTPDRGYCLSVRGVAREAAVALGLPYADPGARVLPGGLRRGVDVALPDPAGCDRYVALTIDGIDPDAATPTWLRRRLERAGMRPISLTVDVTNYVMLELGQPLHAFDQGRLSGGIAVRRAVAGERLLTLDGVDRVLDPGDLVIADDSGPIALAGVMGGEQTEISPATTRVLLESAHFEALTVARTARRHRLPSEASRRFERGVDPALCVAAAAAAAALLADLGAASAVAVTEVDLRPDRPAITLRPAYSGQVGGRPVPADAVRRRLHQVGCNVAGDDPFTVVPPPWRPDLVQAIDLVEEVLRLEGYDTLPSRLPLAPAGRGLTTGQRQRRAVSRALAAAGFVEVSASPFVAADPLGLPDSDPRREVLRLANPLSAQESCLRTTLLPGLLAALGRNLSRGQSDVALYELGVVFRPRPVTPVAPPAAGVRPAPEVLAALDASLPRQPLRAAAVLTGRAEPAGWWGPGRAADWSDAVSAAQSVAGALGVSLIAQADEHAPWHPGRCAALLLGDQVVGHAGELHPALCERWELPPRSCAMELELDGLLAAGADDVTLALPVSTYPPGLVDVAVLVATDVPATAVESALRGGAGPLLEQVRLFDVYTGPPVPAGQRSLAYTMIFRAADRTLSGEEVNAARDAALAAAQAATGASLRA
ncbi:MAG TPA: phenylalanine--tRNA ligase subunit beta [Mycobacteriales bacterium]|nr:phenylalanine--tRNA ligase subunit beta [Mycobacteriales bacterium]